MEEGCSFLNPFECATIPLADWLSAWLRWLVDEYRPVFQAVKYPVDQLLQWFGTILTGIPPTIMLVVIGLFAWQVGGRRLAFTVLAALLFTGFIGVWEDAMTTLSIVITALFLAVLVGIPVGIWAARSDRAWSIIRPVLDTMQTIPAFVYLVPVVMLFGIGNVPGVIVTVVFAMPPLIRLTNLGIRQVSAEVVEAVLAFGATERQLLWKTQIPLAMPTIMAGVNQTLMMSLSMVVISSMIAVGGLGQMVLRGIGRLDVGLAAVGGLGIVMLAIVLDRITQSFSVSKRTPGAIWRGGPIGFVRSAYRSASPHRASAGSELDNLEEAKRPH